MAVIITIIVTIVITILALVLNATPKNYKSSSIHKVLVFSHKNDIDRYGMCYSFKNCI